MLALVFLFVSSLVASSPIEVPDPRCAEPCAFLVASSLDDIEQRFGWMCPIPWPVAAPGECAALERVPECVRAHAGEVATHRWDDVMKHPLTSEVPADTVARSKRFQADAIDRFTRLAKACRAAKEHPTAGAPSFDAATKSVRFGERSFALPKTWKASLTEPDDANGPTHVIVDLGSERVVIERSELAENADWLAPNWNVYAVRDDALVKIGAMRADFGMPTSPGDGTLRAVVEKDNEGFDLVYTPDGKRLKRTFTPAVDYTCADCTACPFVMVHDGTTGERREVGEVLRNIVGAAAEHSDDLAIDVATDAREVVIDLVERKSETTWLDAVALEVEVDRDGIGVRQRIAPRECADVDGAAPACADDGEYDRFARGEERRFTFDLPAGHGTRARLVANGFYVPFGSDVR